MKIEKKILIIIPIILVLLGLFICIYATDIYFENNTIMDQLMWITPIFFAVTLILIFVSFGLSFKNILRILKKVDKKTWLIVIIIFIAGLYLRTVVAPHTHRLYYDEDIYLNIGQSIAKEGKAVTCNYGTPGKCIGGVYNKQPNGYPFLMSFVFLFGGGETQAHILTAIISSLTIITVFLITYLLFENKKISIFSTLIFTLIPITIIWAPTTSSDTVFMFFSGLTIFAFLTYIKINDSKSLLFSISTLVYAVQIRPEGLIIIIPLIIVLIFFKKNIFESIQKKHFILLLIVFSILIAPHIIHMNTVKDNSWGTNQEKLGTEHLEKNLDDNTMFFFENTRFPVAFTLLSLIGLALGKNWKKKIFLVTWFMIFFGLYLFFYAGSFNYGVDVRFSLPMYIPVAILGGCGAYLILKILNKLIEKTIELIKRINEEKNKIKSNWITTVVVTILLIITFIPFISLVSSVGEEAWDARLAHDFLVENIKELDKDSWIFSHSPYVALINGRNAADNYYAQNSDIMDDIFDKTDNVYFYEEYWCGCEPYTSSTCKYFHDNFKLKVYDSVSKKNRNFTLYKIERKW